MKRRILMAALVAMLSIGGALSATAQPWFDGERPMRCEKGPGFGPEGRGEGGMFFGRMAAVLELTDEQQEQVRTILASERDKLAPLRQTVRDSREQLRQAGDQIPFDEAKVRALADTHAKAKADLLVERARVRSQVQAVLTPEQRKLAEKLRPLLDERRGPSRDGRGHGRGPGDGPAGKWAQPQ